MIPGSFLFLYRSMGRLIRDHENWWVLRALGTPREVAAYVTNQETAARWSAGRWHGGCPARGASTRASCIPKAARSRCRRRRGRGGRADEGLGGGGGGRGGGG